MNDERTPLERDAEQLGRRIWPNADSPWREVQGRTVRGGIGRRRMLAPALAMAAVAAVAAVALVNGGRSGDRHQGPLALSSPTAGATPEVRPTQSRSGCCLVQGSRPPITGTPAPTPVATPTPVRIPAALVVRGDADGQTLHLRVGDTFTVELAPVAGHVWDPDEPNDATVVSSLWTDVATDGTLISTYRMIGPGASDIIARRVDCNPDCVDTGIWRITVVVS